MARKPFSIVLEFLGEAIGAKAPGDATDADLLSRFVGAREEAAFTAILQRHGPLVLGICRRVLGNAADAEDAFQATFLVLVRKAGSIRRSGSISCWLHGVAYRVALEARSRAGRRREQEKHATTAEPTDSYGDVATRELRAILDEELGQLPAKYRAPLVLHYLASKTKEETAQYLGWSEGTVSGRLARARDLLRGRLTRRGVTVSSVALAAALTQEAGAVTMASSLANSTLSLVTLFAAGEVAAGASTAQILALTESVVHTMFLTKLKIATAVLLLIAAVGLGGGGLILWAQAEQPPVVQEQPASDPGASAKEPAHVKKPGAVFKVPGSGTLGVALSPDGKILARAGTGKCELWDVASGKILHTLKGNPHFYKVAFSPDGKTLASGTGNVAADKFEVEVKLWDVATGKERVLGKGHPIRAVSNAFSPDGKTLATSYFDPAAVKLWDVATGKEKMELGGVWGSLAFSPDGKTLAIGDSSVHLWDLTTGKKRVSLARKGDWLDVRPFAYSDVLGFSPDGQTLVSAGLHKGKEGDSARLTLWDVATAKERAAIAVPGYSVPNAPPFVFTADGKTLIAAVWIFEKDKEIAIGRVSVQHWDVATGKARASFWTPVNPGGDHEHSGNVVGFYFAALSADGKTVAWGGAEGEGEATNIGTAHVWEVESLATSPPEIPKEVAGKNKQAAEKQKDIEDLRGTWKLRAVEMSGRRKDPKHLQTQMRIDWSALEMDTTEGHKLGIKVIDVSRRPKTIDLVFSKGGDNPIYTSVKAIYLLEGDRLTICRGRERTLPEGFDPITAIWKVEGKPTYTRPEGFNGSSFDSEPRPTELKTQPDDGLTMEIYERVPPEQPIPVRPIFIKPGETKTVTLSIWGGSKDVKLTFAAADVPKGVTFEPANPFVEDPGKVATFTVRAAKDAALGDFAITLTGFCINHGGTPSDQFHLSVDPEGEARRPQSGKPRRRYRHLTDDLFITHDGKLLSIGDGKLIMKSKDGTEHSYTLADKFGSDKFAWDITYSNSGYTVDDLKALLANPATPVIVRVTATKVKPQEPTHIEATNRYDGFMADHNERQRREKEQQESEREKQEIEHQKKVQQDIDHLRGAWLVVSSQTGDKKEPLESLQKQRVIIKGDHLTLASGNERREGTIKIDPQKKSLDWVSPKAADAAMKAIYELKGDDLKIGFGVDNLLRPTRFEMGKDQVGWLLVLKRELRDEQLCLTGHTSHVWSISVSADGKRVLTSSTDQTLRLWDADTGKCLRVFEGHTARVAFGAALSPDGKRVLSGSDDTTMRLWDADTGKEIRKMTGHTAGVDGVAFGPDGMAISTSDRTMHLWDLKTGKKAGVFTGHTGLVSNVSYSDKARLAATCGHAEDPSIRLWDLGTGKELRKLTGPNPPISSVCFSSDGERLLSSAPNDNTVRVWDVASGTELKRIAAAGPYNAAFSPDDKRIVSGGLHDSTVRVWDVATGKELRHYEGHTATVTGVAFFPDGKRLASASFDGTARIWRAPR